MAADHTTDARGRHRSVEDERWLALLNSMAADVRNTILHSQAIIRSTREAIEFLEWLQSPKRV